MKNSKYSKALQSFCFSVFFALVLLRFYPYFGFVYIFLIPLLTGILFGKPARLLGLLYGATVFLLDVLIGNFSLDHVLFMLLLAAPTWIILTILCFPGFLVGSVLHEPFVQKIQKRKAST